MPKKNILLVDDDPDIRDSLRIVLEKEGYHVRTAQNGTQAKEELEKQRPDMMILDVMMATDTEGFDLAFAIRNRPEFEDLPIIMLTSFLDKVREEGPDQFQHVLGEQWPAKWLFEKPVDLKRLIEKISRIFAKE